jgi:hypothetical protein
MTDDNAIAFWEPPSKKAEAEFHGRRWRRPIDPPERIGWNGTSLQCYVLIGVDGTLYSQHRDLQVATRKYQEHHGCCRLRLWDRRYGWRVSRSPPAASQAPSLTAWGHVLRLADVEDYGELYPVGD